MVLATDAKRHVDVREYIKFMTGLESQTAMANMIGYMQGNKIVVENPDMLGNFYASHLNHTTSLKQMPVLGESASFPGNKSLKIIEMIEDYTRNVGYYARYSG